VPLAFLLTRSVHWHTFFQKKYTIEVINKMSKVTAKFQITIPKEVRKSLGIVPGMKVDISKKGNRYVLVANPIEENKKKWRGKFRGKQTTDQYLEEIRGQV